METEDVIYLNVMMVPAFDRDALKPHTAYTVYSSQEEERERASGWTLQDAIRLFRRLHNVGESHVIRLIRPFRHQR